jgi:hypothetical protein
VRIRFAREMQATIGLREEIWSTRYCPFAGINTIATEIIVDDSPCGTTEQQGYSDKGRQQAN